jgi:hypothetical protein
MWNGNLSDFITLCKLAFWIKAVTLNLKWHIIWLNLVIYDCSITSMEKKSKKSYIVRFFCAMELLSLDQLIHLNSNHQPPSYTLCTLHCYVLARSHASFTFTLTFSQDFMFHSHICILIHSFSHALVVL